jgi:hypothetical protein
MPEMREHEKHNPAVRLRGARERQQSERRLFIGACVWLGRLVLRRRLRVQLTKTQVATKGLPGLEINGSKSMVGTSRPIVAIRARSF